MPWQKLPQSYLTILLGIIVFVFTNPVLACEEFVQIQQQICQGSTYQFNDRELSETGIYTDTLKTIEDCDSIIELDLIVIPRPEIHVDTSICQGNSYQIETFSFDESIDTTFIINDISGCETLVHLSLAVRPSDYISTFVSICEGQTYQVGNSIYDETGTYTDTLTNSLLCDSIIVTQLTVNPIKKTQIQVSICHGESYTVGNNVYDEAGIYNDTLQSQIGCDSIVTLNLTLLPSYHHVFHQQICEGTSFQLGDSTYISAGTYTLQLVSSDLCDSIITLNLEVLPTTYHQQSFTICEGQSVQVGNHSYAEDGIYQDTLVNYLGCDSIITTEIILLPVIRIQLQPVICQGQTFSVGNSIYDTSGTYTDTLTASNTCDSIITTILTVTNIIQSQTTQYICEGNIYEWNGHMLDSAGIYRDTLTSSSGCDSIAILQLFFTSATQTNIIQNICAGSTFTVGSNVYDSTGIYLDTLQTTIGCDSIVILNLTVKDVIIKNVNATICEGNSYFIGDSEYTSPGNYMKVLTAQDGCDSTIHLQLTVEEIKSITLTPTICQGSIFQVGDKLYNASGTYVDTLKNINQCDSIVTTILSVAPISSEQITRTICQGQSITIGNNTYSQPGLYRDTLTSIFGCDSIINLRLFVQNQITAQQTLHFCEGQSYSIGTNTYVTSGTYIDTLVSSGGCDSILTSTLYFHPTYQLEISRSICQGDSISFGNLVINNAGIYTQTFPSLYQCDSTVQLTVDILRKDYRVEERSSCQGSTIFIQGNTFTHDTTFALSYTNTVGCDSTIEYRLHFNPTYQTLLQKDVCRGTYYQNVLIDKDTTLSFQLTSILGCDSTVTVKVRALNILVTTRSLALCSGEEHNGVIITRDTILQKVLNSSLGCDSIVIDTIHVLEGFDMYVSQDTTINPGQSVTLFASGGLSYIWNTGATSPSIVVKPQITTIYTVTGVNANGCKEVKEITVFVNSCNISAANYFTPNGDGKHDTWKISGGECLSEFTLRVINRWGDVVFETEEISTAWDGNYKGKPAPEGVYFFILEGLSAQDQKVIQENGYIHLNR